MNDWIYLWVNVAVMAVPLIASLSSTRESSSSLIVSHVQSLLSAAVSVMLSS